MTTGCGGAQQVTRTQWPGCRATAATVARASMIPIPIPLARWPPAPASAAERPAAIKRSLSLLARIPPDASTLRPDSGTTTTGQWGRLIGQRLPSSLSIASSLHRLAPFAGHNKWRSQTRGPGGLVAAEGGGGSAPSRPANGSPNRRATRATMRRPFRQTGARKAAGAKTTAHQDGPRQAGQQPVRVGRGLARASSLICLDNRLAARRRTTHLSADLCPGVELVARDNAQPTTTTTKWAGRKLGAGPDSGALESAGQWRRPAQLSLIGPDGRASGLGAPDGRPGARRRAHSWPGGRPAGRDGGRPGSAPPPARGTAAEGNERTKSTKSSKRQQQERRPTLATSKFAPAKTDALPEALNQRLEPQLR